MPIYEYRCNKCGIVQDLIVPFNDRKKETKCPECFNGNLQFVDKIHNSKFYLKGAGWYETDFKK